MDVQGKEKDVYSGPKTTVSQGIDLAQPVSSDDVPKPFFIDSLPPNDSSNENVPEPSSAMMTKI